MWDIPPIIKVYEALGAVADGRIILDGNTARCLSSSGNKTYEIMYDPEAHAIMTNDNASFWKGYLGYPAIAFLILKNVLPYRADLASILKGIAWKDINQQFKNDFDKTLEYIFAPLDTTTQQLLNEYGNSILSRIKELNLKKLGKKVKPPSGY